MRPLPLALALLVGCGSVSLGEEPYPETDLDASGVLDGGAAPDLRAVITIAVPDAGCAACLELTATGAGGAVPYSFEWDDGTKQPRRRVCAPVSQDAFTVTVRDANGHVSPPQVLRPDLPLPICADASVSMLELANPSFEGTPMYNAGGQFNAPPWSDCTQPPRYNAPQVVNASIRQWVTEVPPPTQGQTFLGLIEGQQASQPLRESLRNGDMRSFRFDARQLDISNATLDKTEGAFLEVSGGVSANCTVRELLYVSPRLTYEWRTYCATIAPSEYTDQLTLRAISDESQIQSVFLLVDNIVPVPSCR